VHTFKERFMKKRDLPILCAIMGIASISQAAEPWHQPSRGRGLMLYVSKPISSSVSRAERLSFGLRLETGTTGASLRPVPLLDFRYAVGGKRSVLAGGVRMLDGSSSLHSPAALAAAIAAGALGVACLAEVGICKGGGNDTYQPPGE
jgi:hypothetical protein